ncbi:ABC transporter permease [Streptomyces sp. NPDC001508]|uniref:ABC transporter permease n=1 Tax=Streptomyces sp. NPDC001508 TaxID=3154656 RepID=UPI00332DA4CB
MARYLLRRLVFLAVSLALASVVLFVLLRMLPGDPANALTSVGASPEQIAAARHSIGSDRPLPEQFAHWLGQLASGDLGTSFVSSLPVGPEVSARLDVTVPLTLAAFVLAVLIAVPAGFLAAHKRHTWYGALLSGVSQLGIAIPVFWLGMIFIAVFALNAGWLPAGGFPQDGWSAPADAVRSLVLPVLTIALVMSASLIRYVRSATLDVLGSDHLRTARALGSSFGRAMWRHGLRNAAVPVISVLGIELASTLLGAVVVESVYALPGLGSMLATGIAQHDYPVIQGVLFVSTLAVLLIGFVADLVQRIIDPRLRDRLTGGAR